MRPHTLLEIAKRNDYPLPADTVEGLAELYEFRDFAQFIEVWVLTTNALRETADFRQVVVDYAAEAAAHGAVYLEGIFSPAERVRRDVSWESIFEGYCDGALEAFELHGVEVRLTPDVTRGFGLDEAEATVRWASRYRDRGVVGVGLGGLEADYPPEPYAQVFELGAEPRAPRRASRRRGCGRGLDPWRRGGARSRPPAARHPRRGGSRPGGGAPRSRARPRRLPDLERPHRRRRLARRAPPP